MIRSRSLEERGPQPGAAVESEAAKLLIVDDDPAILNQLGMWLEDEFRVFTAGTAEAAWQIIQTEHPELLTLDLALERGDPETGFSLFERCLEREPFLKILLITGNDSHTNALRAEERGATHFLGKPVDPQELRFLLRRALASSRLGRESAGIQRQVGGESRLGALVGRSEAMRTLFRNVRKAAPVDVTVLILGESGTGKELVAREIRRLGGRAAKPFVSIDCGAIVESLLESELFGHERGAYTGAHVSRVGRLELAQGGIVFLDEVGELSLSLQVKLLRFLQERQIERVGGREVIDLDVRVIAATSRDLEEEARKGTFRQDLYYRLSVVNLKIPPLRARQDDILLLAEHFLERSANEFARGRRKAFTARARVALQAHAWPGNVRELEHRVQRGVLMSAGRLVTPEDLELGGMEAPQRVNLREARDQADRGAICEALRHTGGNVSKAAESLGISRPSLYELLEKLELDAGRFREGRRGRGIADHG
jgi:two-component system NtrC family response regulator